LAKGTARFLGPDRVAVVDQVYRSTRFLVAVGGNPRIPRLPGLETTPFLTSRGALLLKTIPASLIIIGGGVIAVELGQMFQRLGTRVTILEHGPRILAPVESEPALAVRNVLREEGVEIVCCAAVCSVSGNGAEVRVEAEREGARMSFTAEKLLLAAGTAPATQGIGLELAGVETDSRGFVTVDGRMRTTAPGIWAAGDCTGGMMIATVGAREGIVAVDDMLNPGCGCTFDPLSVPMAIFTDPEVGIVGHTEEGAKAAGFDVAVNVMPASFIPKAHVTGHTAGVIKLVADRATGRLLGVHLACHRGAELINEAALAIRLRATVEDLANALHVYPSMGEGLRLCAQGFSRDISRLSCCAE
jgi:mercuric reductase